MRTSLSASVLLALLVGCAYEVPSGADEGSPAPRRPPDPIAATQAAVISPGELTGFRSRVFGGRDFNRCVPDPVGQLRRLRTHGEIMGVHTDGYAELEGTDLHWQGVQRLNVADGRYMALSSSHEASLGGHMALVHLGSRDRDHERFRGNRMSRYGRDWDVAPSWEDTMTRDIQVNTSFNHPGGMQTIGQFLLMSLEKTDPGSSKARMYLYDLNGLTDPPSCSSPSSPGCPVKRWGYVVQGSGAGTAAISKLSDERYVMITSRRGLWDLEVYVSTPGRDLADPAVFGSWKVTSAFFDGDAHDDWRDYNNIQLLTACEDGQLYLLGAHRSSFWDGQDDWLDLFELDLVANGGRNADGQPTYDVSLRKVANRHLYCSATGGGSQCHFDAAVGTYVDPDGRLLVYAAEHNRSGPSRTVTMMEYAPENPAEDPDTWWTDACGRDAAWVDLYPSTSPEGARMHVPYRDRNARRYEHFGDAYDLNDRVRSARWCIPRGLRYRLFSESNHWGPRQYDLVGTGYPRSVGWSTNEGWSSGCFHDGTRCVSPYDFVAPGGLQMQTLGFR